MLRRKAFNYIFMQLAVPFMLCLVGIVSFVFILQFLQLSHVIFSDRASFFLFLEIFSLLILSYLPTFLPLCLLFAILFGYESLSQNTELAIFSSFGYNKVQMALPACLLAGMSFLGSLYILHTLGPASSHLSNTLEYNLKRKAAAFVIKPGVFFDKVANYTVYAESEDRKGVLKNLFIRYRGKDGKFNIFSNSGALVKDKVGLEGIVLRDGQAYSVLDNKNSNLILTFKTYKINFFNNFGNSVGKSSSPLQDKKTFTLLKSFEKETKENKFLIKKEIIKRFLIPLSCLFFLFMGSLLGIRLHSRSKKGSSFFFAFVVFVTFWLTLLISEHLVNSFSTISLMFTPLIVCTLVGVLAFWVFHKKEII